MDVPQEVFEDVPQESLEVFVDVPETSHQVLVGAPQSPIEASSGVPQTPPKTIQLCSYESKISCRSGNENEDFFKTNVEMKCAPWHVVTYTLASSKATFRKESHLCMYCRRTKYSEACVDDMVCEVSRHHGWTAQYLPETQARNDLFMRRVMVAAGFHIQQFAGL